MKCRECKHFDLWLHPKHAALGLGNCKALGPGVFSSVKRDIECELYEKASDEAIFKRMDWAIKRELV
jgi:hypothetical protein